MSTAKDRLKALTSAFVDKTNTSGAGNQTPAWKKFYQFWKMPDNTTAVVRFLPDKDEDSNPLKFLAENLSHELIVNGQRKKVPCLTMYGESCPICEHSQKLYAEGNEEMGKKYYKKRSYIGQVLVLESPFDYVDEKDENPDLIKLIDFGPKIFKCIQTAFQSGDLEEAPYEFDGGYNFRIKKTKAGQWSDYGTSSFAPKQTGIDADILDLVRPKLYSLSEYREKYITRVALEALLLADQTGKAIDESQEQNNAPADKNQNSQAPQEPKNDASSGAETPSDSSGSSSTKAQSVLEQLRARAAAKKAETA